MAVRCTWRTSLLTLLSPLPGPVSLLCWGSTRPRSKSQAFCPHTATLALPPQHISTCSKKKSPQTQVSSWGHSAALAGVEPRTEFSGWRPGEGCGLGARGAESSEPFPPELPGELAFLLPPTIY